MSRSTQHLLDAKRPPRVQITYDVEVGDAVESCELPYVFGVMADLSGMSPLVRPPLKNRKFSSMPFGHLSFKSTQISKKADPPHIIQ